MVELVKPYQIIGKYCISGTSKKDNKPYVYYKICVVTSTLQTDLVVSRKEGVFVNRFDCTPELFNDVAVGDTFTEPLYNSNSVVCFLRP